MSWIRETREHQPSWIHRFCQRVLKAGPVPRHVAFIMDGNRRFARKNSMDCVQGHIMGFDKLSETLEWCNNIGIQEVTVYAFSIENFKRSQQEVDGLMELARQKFARLNEEKENLNKYGVCIRVLGNLSLLPQDVQECIAEAVTMTKHNNRAVLNVCFAYTSRDEIANAMREMADGVERGILRESDISEGLLEKCLYTCKSPNPDILVRTSGEVRLSDFLLWQTTHSCLSFMRVLWPEFSIWHLYAGVLHYQRHHKEIQKAVTDSHADREKRQRESDLLCVMTEINEEHKNNNIANGSTRLTDSVLEEKLSQYTSTREERTALFLEHLENKREQYFQNLLSKRKVHNVT